MTKTQIAAVLTTQFLTKTTAACRRSLLILSRLPISRVIVVTDEKEPHGKTLADRAIAETANELSSAGIAAEVLCVNCYSTARRWWPGICNVFRESTIQTVVNFPGDLTDDLSEAQIQTMTEALIGSADSELLLFDYSSSETFKERFDELFLIPLLQAAHPETLEKVRALGHSKLRTEIFLLGRKPFESFKANLGRSWGTDPTLQMVLNCWEADLPVRSISLGSIRDDGNTRSNPGGKSLQITRIAAQLQGDATISLNYGRVPRTSNTWGCISDLAERLAEEVKRCLRRARRLEDLNNHQTIDCIAGARISIATHFVGGRAQGQGKSRSSLERFVEALRKLLVHFPSEGTSILVLVQPASRTLLNQDRRANDQRAWTDEASRLNSIGLYPPIDLVYDSEYRAFEPPSLVWGALQRRAFEGTHPADSMVYVDVNIGGWPECQLELFRPGFHRLLAASVRADYVIGDYEPVIPIAAPNRRNDVQVKVVIEQFVKQALVEAFPDLLSGWDAWESLRRPRSEFHALNRKTFSHLAMKPYAPFDYGLFMVVAARCYGLQIEVVDIGEVPETSSNRPEKLVEQAIKRVPLQIDQMRRFRKLLNPTNPKLIIRGLDSSFAPFPGFSLIFDNPKATWSPRHDGLVDMKCHGSGNPEFFARLFEALNSIDLPGLRLRWGLVPLDPASAHCTVLDGHVLGTVEAVNSEHRERISQFIKQLPQSLSVAETAMPEILNSSLVTQRFPISFEFEELAIFSQAGALVAKLRTSDDASAKVLTRINAARQELAESTAHLGLKARDYTPHVSLAYLPDLDLAHRAADQLPWWNEVFRQKLKGAVLHFDKVVLMGFLDMITFLKKAS